MLELRAAGKTVRQIAAELEVTPQAVYQQVGGGERVYRKQGPPRFAAKPIMIYPRTPAERQQIEQAAEAQRKGLSPFVLDVVSGHIQGSTRRRKRSLPHETAVA